MHDFSQFIPEIALHTRRLSSCVFFSGARFVLGGLALGRLPSRCAALLTVRIRSFTPFLIFFFKFFFLAL